ncbi:MAG: tRNA (cytidine(56)-2'-O)-methyltransferase [Candidatus ainarchaeum sp.]|nr:tRNA (cytidine(56)-2'-O)-methyltransferase [Candidatus ainarchaeum sp.]
MIIVLRLGHRIPRDERITTHVALVSRAFGAEKMIYTGQKDSGMEESVKKISEEWGGNFIAEYSKNGLGIVKEMRRKGSKIIHLTMYGIDFNEKMEEIKKIEENSDILIVVGGAQVPIEFYKISDFNLSVTNQPHSEVAALAVLLNELNSKNKVFEGKKRITPSENKKIIITKN